MTSNNQTTDLATEATAHIADADNNAALVSSLADTDSNGLAQAEPGTQSKYPAWLLELTHQLRNFRQWRLIIKPDQTLDLGVRVREIILRALECVRRQVRAVMERRARDRSGLARNRTGECETSIEIGGTHRRIMT